MRYFISDLHFSHRVPLKLERKQFTNTKEHDEYIINAVNSKVKPTDELWILGDVGRLDLVSRLNGRKTLIMGNHDKRPMKEYEGYFATIHKFPVFISNRILLSHYPLPVAPGMVNFHGHLHGSELDSVQHFNLSAHMVNYLPLSETELERETDKLLQGARFQKKFLEEWYADKYIFSDLDRNDVITNEWGKIDLEKSKSIRADQFVGIDIGEYTAIIEYEFRAVYYIATLRHNVNESIIMLRLWATKDLEKIVQKRIVDESDKDNNEILATFLNRLAKGPSIMKRLGEKL